MENAILIAGIAFGVILILMASGMWISVALGVVGIIVFAVWVGGGALQTIGLLQFNTTNSFTYTAVPLFIFMGELILRSGLGDKLYRGASHWVGRLPGGLLHTNIIACAIFSAVSGSSMATAATISTTAVPELRKRGYNERLLLGSLAAGGTLGILIPPSMVMILYGAFVGQSVGKLFMAGLIPGICLSGLFMAYIAAHSMINPHLVPLEERVKSSPKVMLSSLLDILPILVLIFMVLGTIYMGVATPTESAGLGAFISLVFCMGYRKLSWQVLKKSLLGTVKITSWVMLIIIGARILSMSLAVLKVPMQFAAIVASTGLDRMWIFAFIVILYLILGCFMDAVSMIFLTLPVIYPLITSLGFDPIWFGVQLVIFVEMGQITPPVGVNLFVLQGIGGEDCLPHLIRGIIPFLFCMILMVILLVAFPSLATWLPKHIKPF